jgi:hypothetical protein
VADGDGVPDGDLVGADEDVFDEQSQDPLTFGDVGCGGLVFQSGKEVLNVVGEGQIDLPVGELGVEGLDLLAQAGFAVSEFGHPGSKFIEGDQLFLVGADQSFDGFSGFNQSGLEALALDGCGVGGPGVGESPGDFGPDQRRVGEQGGDVVPDEAVEVVGAHRFVGADPAVLVAVVVRTEASIVVDDLVRGAGRGAVVGVSAAGASANSL